MRETKEYREGQQAFLEHGDTNVDQLCPYESRSGYSNERADWFRGFLDARTPWRLAQKGVKL